MRSSEAIDASTEEGRLRMQLIDAVHDADYHTRAVLDRHQLDLFGEPPTT